MFQAMIGKDGGSDGVDGAYAHRSMDGFGAFILAICSGLSAVRGRTRAGRAGGATIRPYHAPTFVLTHHPRDPIEMEGGTTFIFVTDIEAALDQAKLAANGRDVKIGGGVETARQYLRAGLVDELHFALSPVVLGQSERCSPGSTCRRSAIDVTEISTDMPPRRSPPITSSSTRSIWRPKRLEVR